MTNDKTGWDEINEIVDSQAPYIMSATLLKDISAIIDSEIEGYKYGMLHSDLYKSTLNKIMHFCIELIKNVDKQNEKTKYCDLAKEKFYDTNLFDFRKYVSDGFDDKEAEHIRNLFDTRAFEFEDITELEMEEDLTHRTGEAGSFLGEYDWPEKLEEGNLSEDDYPFDKERINIVAVNIDGG